jgi:cell division protein FtsB
MKKKYIVYAVTLGLAALFLCVWMSFGQNGLFDLFTMQSEKRENKIILKELRAKNRILACEIRRLKEDPEYLESVARKQLGMVKGNEIIYRIGEGERGTVTVPIKGE